MLTNNCRITIYSYLPINEQFRVISKLSIKERQLAENIKYHIENSKDYLEIDLQIPEFTNQQSTLKYICNFSKRYSFCMDKQKDDNSLMSFISFIKEMEIKMQNNTFKLKLNALSQYILEIIDKWQIQNQCQLEIDNLSFNKQRFNEKLQILKLKRIKNLCFNDCQIQFQQYESKQSSLNVLQQISEKSKEIDELYKHEQDVKILTLKNTVVVDYILFSKIKNLEVLEIDGSFLSENVLNFFSKQTSITKLVLKDLYYQGINNIHYWDSSFVYDLGLSKFFQSFQVNKFRNLEEINIKVTNCKEFIDFHKSLQLPKLKKINARFNQNLILNEILKHLSLVNQTIVEIEVTTLTLFNAIDEQFGITFLDAIRDTKSSLSKMGSCFGLEIVQDINNITNKEAAKYNITNRFKNLTHSVTVLKDIYEEQQIIAYED